MSALRVLVCFLFAGTAFAQPADTVLVNGKVLAGDGAFAVREALAVRGDRIVAVGTNPEFRKLKGRNTRVVDLQGRTVIPGLVDSHMHAIRAALSFSTEVNWIGAATLESLLTMVGGKVVYAAGPYRNLK